MTKINWDEEGPIMDEFDLTLKHLHESTHDSKVRESLLIVQEYKTKYLDKPKKGKEYQTIVDRDDKYVVVTRLSGYSEYVLGHCDIPELYSMDASLEGIDRYYHNTLMEEFTEMGCKLKRMMVHNMIKEEDDMTPKEYKDFSGNLTGTIADEISKIYKKEVTLDNDGEKHINTYRVYIEGERTEMTISYEEMMYFNECDIKEMVELIEEDCK